MLPSMTRSYKGIKNVLPPTPIHLLPTNGREFHHVKYRHASDLLLNKTGSKSKTGPSLLPFLFFLACFRLSFPKLLSPH